MGLCWASWVEKTDSGIQRLIAAWCTATKPTARMTLTSGLSSGGMPAVQAMGVLLENPGEPRMAQVSMNLVDFRKTSLADLLARVAAEAAAPQRIAQNDDPVPAIE